MNGEEIDNGNGNGNGNGEWVCVECEGGAVECGPDRDELCQSERLRRAKLSNRWQQSFVYCGECPVRVTITFDGKLKVRMQHDPKAKEEGRCPKPKASGGTGAKIDAS